MPGTVKKGPKSRKPKRHRRPANRRTLHETRTRGITNVRIALNQIADARGNGAEECFARIIKEAKRVGLVRASWQTRRGSAWDRLGYDFVIEFTAMPGVAFPIQVKSSWRGASEFRLRGRGDSLIPIFVAHPEEYREETLLARRFIREIALPCIQDVRAGSRRVRTLTVPRPKKTTGSSQFLP
ncbi:MAG: hypothetical protein HY475_01110 [Candidatus Terrybacteria bacterium]|nr:hypothetical protein [Candidatus Terrybacteria bacterium]